MQHLLLVLSGKFQRVIIFFFPFMETVVILELERHVWSLFFSLALSVVFLGVCPFPDIVNMHSSIINRFLDFY